MLPKRHYKDDAGYDIYIPRSNYEQLQTEIKASLETNKDTFCYKFGRDILCKVLLNKQQIHLKISLGQRWLLPQGYYGQIMTRSSRFFDYHTMPGVIDFGFSGEVFVKLILTDRSVTSWCQPGLDDEFLQLFKNMRLYEDAICQLLLLPYRSDILVQEVYAYERDNESNYRSESGDGSTSLQ